MTKPERALRDSFWFSVGILIGVLLVHVFA
jgi:hypothetical protein